MTSEEKRLRRDKRIAVGAASIAALGLGAMYLKTNPAVAKKSAEFISKKVGVGMKKVTAVNRAKRNTQLVLDLVFSG